MKNRITCRLSGGLGNQLFMYAACRALAERTDSILVLDIHSGYQHDHKYKRSFLLNNFNINCEIAEKSYLSKSMNKLIRKFKIFLNDPSIYLYQKNIFFNNEFNRILIKNDITIEGYWQSEKYFLDIKNIIRKEFTLKNYDYSPNYYKWKNLITTGQTVAFHFRFYEDISGNLDSKYYLRAVEYLNINFRESKYFIFTNNVDYFHRNFSYIFTNSFIVSEDKLNEIEEFELMRMCNAHVIANSTFSWWAAWLSNSQLIISPIFKKFSGEGAWGFTGLIPEYFIEL